MVGGGSPNRHLDNVSPRINGIFAISVNRVFGELEGIYRSLAGEIANYAIWSFRFKKSLIREFSRRE